MEYLLFTIYLCLGLLLLPKVSFIKKSGLSIFELRMLLAIKLLLGILFTAYLSKYFIDGDYYVFNELGKKEYHLLLQNPQSFFSLSNVYTNSINYKVLFDAQGFWVHDLAFNVIYKTLAILNLFSFGNFYTNTILFCFFVFFAHVAFYRIYKIVFGNSNKWVLLLSTFFLPSALLYTSCLHKDGFIFIGVAFISYIFFVALNNSSNTNSTKSLKPQYYYVFIFLINALLIFVVRNYVLIAMIPSLFAWCLSNKLNIKKYQTFIGCYLIYIFLFFLSIYSRGQLNLPYAFIQRKAEFAKLALGTTTISMYELRPNFGGFLHNFPQALNHSLLRPYLWEFGKWNIILTALEVTAYLLLFIVFLFFRKKSTLNNDGFILFGFAFFISMMLIIGYTIPNIGAIVRYRSIYWIFIICPMSCSIDWQKIKAIFKR